ncbi:MAG TPA: HEAT repeat domain-containing protein [Pyrinomonadaceae bacterium]|jgi:hypothetical protein
MMREAFLLLMMCMLGGCGGILSLSAAAQGQELDQMEAPPPMKYIPRAELERLSAVADTKARTRLSLELIEERLENAERLTRSQQFAAASAELGIYQSLIEDALRYIRARSNTNDKHRDLFKLMELSFRAQGSRIEAIRRVTPFDDAANVKAAYEYVWGARTEALNAFYGEQVVTEESAPKKKNVRESGGGDSFARLDEAFALLADKPKAASAIPILVELLKDTDAFIRLDAAYALGFIGPEARTAVPDLIALLKDQEAMVRNNAAYALGLIKSDADRVVPELVKLIRDRDARVRFNAAEAIGRFGQAAVPALNKVTQDEK